MRLLPFLLCLTACAPPDEPPRSEAFAAQPAPSSTPALAPADSFDAQTWLADARSTLVSLEDATYDDPEVERMKTLAGELDEAVNWGRACDTYRDYETGEIVYDPILPGQGHWVRGTLEIGDISDAEAVVAVTCDYGAYQGSYAFVYVAPSGAMLLSAPELDENDRLMEEPRTVFATPDFSRVDEGIVATFARARGLGDCGDYVVYMLSDGGGLALREVRRRECGDDIPDELPPPSEWPVVYRAED